MRFFLRTKKFKILAALLCLILVVSLSFRVFSGFFSPGSGVLGTVIAPFQNLFSNISNGIGNFTKSVKGGNELILENKRLEEELSEMRALLAENDELRLQNEFYKEYLEIKEANPDFQFCRSKIISRDSGDPFCSFTVNKGSKDGIKQYDPVISGNYLIGYVEQVGFNSSKVVTLLSPHITVGVNDSRTGDPGIITGTAVFAEENKVKLYNLSRDCTVAVGDFIVTSGEGVFPEGLLIGSVDNIRNDDNTFSAYASVSVFAKFYDLKSVMVLTDFEGQTTIGED